MAAAIVMGGAAGRPAWSALFADPMEGVGAWETGGGANSTNRSLAADTGLYTEGTGSLRLSADYLASGFAYTDLNLLLPAPLDLGAGTFQIDYRPEAVALAFRWTLRTKGHIYYHAYFHPAGAGFWQTVSLLPADFGASPGDLAAVDFMQLQVVADGVVPLPATISVNYDNLRVIPEPSSIALLAAALVLANLRRR